MSSCKKTIKGCMDAKSISYNKDANEDNGLCQYAGTGGNVTMVVFPQHHTLPIINRTVYCDTIYIKFNTQDFPGTNPNSYDTHITGYVGEDHVHCVGFNPGYYDLYAVGFDSTINARVSGGIPVSFTDSSGEKVFYVPVTE